MPVLCRICLLIGLIVIGVANPRPALAVSSEIRIIHGIPGDLRVDVFVDGTLARANDTPSTTIELRDVGYGTIRYVTTSYGPHTVVLARAGQGIGAARAMASVTLAENRGVTVALLGPVTNLRVQTYPLSLQGELAPLAPTQAYVRLSHLAPGAGAVAMRLDDVVLVPRVTFEEASNYVAISPGTHAVSITRPAAGAVLVDLPARSFVAGTLYDVVVLGQSPTLTASIDDVLVFSSPEAPDSAVPGAAVPEPITLPDTGQSDYRNLPYLALTLLALIGGAYLRWRARPALRKLRG